MQEQIMGPMLRTAGSTRRALAFLLAISIAFLIASASCFAQVEIRITPAKPANEADPPEGDSDEVPAGKKGPGPDALIVQAHQVTAETTAGSSLFLVDRERAQKFRDAQKFVQANDLGSALSSLQEILDAPDDGYYADRIDDGAVRRGWKESAERLLATIVTRDGDSYERLFGPTARRLLDESSSSGDFESLKAVARRYFHTAAGKDATYRLAAHYLDHNQPYLAEACFQRLRKLAESASRYEPALTVQLAMCQARRGQADAARKTLSELHGDKALHFGDRTIARFESGSDPLVWLSENFGAPTAAEGISKWRTQTAEIETAVLSPHSARGQKPTVWSVASYNRSADRKVQTPSSAMFDALFTVRRGDASNYGFTLPKAMPLLANDVVVYRTPGYLSALDARTGESLWQSELDADAAGFLPPPTKGNRGVSPPHTLCRLMQQRMWQDANYGTLTSDGERVYAIENLGLARAVKESRTKRYIHPSASNRLVARDLHSGDIVWNSHETVEAFDSVKGNLFWLGAPLSFGGELLALADRDRKIDLVSLDARTGQLQWSKTVSLAGTDIAADFYRRLCGIWPVVAEGLVIVPTGTGSVVAVDQESRQFVWAYTPSDTYDSRPLLQNANIPLAHKTHEGVTDWFDSRVTVAGDKVLVRPRGADSIYCLELKTGDFVWKHRCDDFWFLAGVSNDVAILVGQGAVNAYDMSTGNAVWKEPLTIHHPRGRGFISDGVLYVPTTSAEIFAVRISSGELMSKRRTPGSEGLGNLTREGDVIVSQDMKTVRLFPFAPSAIQDVAETSLPAGLPIITPGERELR